MKSILLIKMYLGLVEMTFGLVYASFRLPEWRALKMTFFAPYLFSKQSCLVPVRRFPTPFRSIHFVDVSQASLLRPRVPRFKLVLWKGTYFACPMADQGFKRPLQHQSLSLPQTSNIVLLYIELSRLHCNRFNGQQTQKHLLFSHLSR